MARSRIDLNRFKKIYPLQRKSPHYFTQTINSHAYELEFANQSQNTVATTDVNSPIVTITGVGTNSNVNVWIETLARDTTTGIWSVTVKASAAFTGSVHILVTEGAP